MIIATTYENDMIAPNFGTAPAFKLFYINNRKFEVAGSEIVEIADHSADAIADFLLSRNVDAVLCGGIGKDHIQAIQMVGIIIYPALLGRPDELVNLFLEEGVRQTQARAEQGCCGHHGGGGCCGHHGHGEGEEHECCHGEGHGEDHECCHGEGHGHGHGEGGCCGGHGHGHGGGGCCHNS